MKNDFYRPEKIDTREFGMIVNKMKSDLEALIINQSTKQETKEYVEKLIKDGKPLSHKPNWIFWGFTEPDDMESDARVDFLYMPTYIAAAFLVKSTLLYPEFLEEIPNLRNILRGALLACTGRNFAGHGIKTLDGRLSAIRLFLNADIHFFIKKHPNICPHFTKLFDLTIGILVRNFSLTIRVLDEIVQIYESVGDLQHKERYYLAYGINMNKTEIMKRCQTVEFIGTSSIQDYILRFHRHANIEFAKGESTPVLVWKLQEKDEKHLDGYEGFPKHYMKKDFRVEVNGNPISAMAYVMTPEKIKRGKNKLPDNDYLNKIKEGYRNEGLIETSIYKALSFIQSKNE